MKKYLFQMILFLFLPFATGMHVLAGGPTEQIRHTSDKIISILTDPSLKIPERAAEKKTILSEAVTERFDWEEFSRRALARHWRKRTDEEKREFISLFGSLVERIYRDRVANYLVEKLNVYYDSESVEGKYGVVKVRIAINNKPEIPVNYRVIRKGNDWFVYDISVKGISFVRNYRVQFGHILNRASYKELIKRLKEKIAEE